LRRSFQLYIFLSLGGEHKQCHDRYGSTNNFILLIIYKVANDRYKYCLTSDSNALSAPSGCHDVSEQWEQRRNRNPVLIVTDTVKIIPG